MSPIQGWLSLSDDSLDGVLCDWQCLRRRLPLRASLGLPQNPGADLSRLQHGKLNLQQRRGKSWFNQKVREIKYSGQTLVKLCQRGAISLLCRSRKYALVSDSDKPKSRSRPPFDTLCAIDEETTPRRHDPLTGIKLRAWVLASHYHKLF